MQSMRNGFNTNVIKTQYMGIRGGNYKNLEFETINFKHCKDIVSCCSISKTGKQKNTDNKVCQDREQFISITQKTKTIVSTNRRLNIYDNEVLWTQYIRF